MKCEEVDSRMIDFLDKNLEESMYQEIERHLVSCERCLDEFKDSQKIMNLLSMNKMEKPDDSLRINFYHMLHSQIKKGSEVSTGMPQGQPGQLNFLMKYRFAAGIALLICGTFIGILIHASLINNSEDLKNLQAEVSALKEASMLTMLREESSSDRIQAVSLIEELDKPDEKVIEVLINTLNHDKNINVRMAAAYALSKYANQRSVTDSLVKSLALQEDPIIQITLINILVERKEKKAMQPIRRIIEDKNTIKEVKAVAENGMKVLI
jgi:aminopeptidase N